jgi:hypothetical protein
MVKEYVFGLVRYELPTSSMSIKTGMGFTSLYPESLNLYFTIIAAINRIT